MFSTEFGEHRCQQTKTYGEHKKAVHRLEQEELQFLSKNYVLVQQYFKCDIDRIHEDAAVDIRSMTPELIDESCRIEISLDKQIHHLNQYLICLLHLVVALSSLSFLE